MSYEKEMIDVGKQLGRIEEHTKAIPKMQEVINEMNIEVKFNTRFRKNFLRFKWISITAFIGFITGIFTRKS